MEKKATPNLSFWCSILEMDAAKRRMVELEEALKKKSREVVEFLNLPWVVLVERGKPYLILKALGSTDPTECLLSLGGLHIVGSQAVFGDERGEDPLEVVRLSLWKDMEAARKAAAQLDTLKPLFEKLVSRGAKDIWARHMRPNIMLPTLYANSLPDGSLPVVNEEVTTVQPSDSVSILGPTSPGIDRFYPIDRKKRAGSLVQEMPPGALPIYDKEPDCAEIVCEESE